MVRIEELVGGLGCCGSGVRFLLNASSRGSTAGLCQTELKGGLGCSGIGDIFLEDSTSDNGIAILSRGVSGSTVMSFSTIGSLSRDLELPEINAIVSCQMRFQNCSLIYRLFNITANTKRNELQRIQTTTTQFTSKRTILRS